jgi:hypothetical protein
LKSTIPRTVFNTLFPKGSINSPVKKALSDPNLLNPDLDQNPDPCFMEILTRVQVFDDHKIEREKISCEKNFFGSKIGNYLFLAHFGLWRSFVDPVPDSQSGSRDSK